MPYMPIVGTLVKSDRRGQWTALKSKHSKALAAKKIDFDAKLGPALDKYQVQVKAVDKLFAVEHLSQPAVQKLLAAARPLDQIATLYLDKVKGLGDPAEKELTAFLNALSLDCTGWEQVSEMFEKSAVPTTGASQVAAVKELYGRLDRLSGQLENLAKSLPAAQAELKIARKKTARPARVTGLTQKEWTQVLGAKIDAILANAVSLNAKRAALQSDLGPLLTAGVHFSASSDYSIFKDRAKTIAASSLTAFHGQVHSFLLLQDDIDIKGKLGFDKGLPGIEYRRASISGAAARLHAEKLIEDIHQMP